MRSPDDHLVRIPHWAVLIRSSERRSPLYKWLNKSSLTWVDLPLHHSRNLWALKTHSGQWRKISRLVPRLKYFFGAVPKKDFQIDGQSIDFRVRSINTKTHAIYRVQWTIFRAWKKLKNIGTYNFINRNNLNCQETFVFDKLEVENVSKPFAQTEPMRQK